MAFCKGEMMEIRQLTGLSQEYAAGLLNVSRTLIAMYENGSRRLPTSALLYEIELQTEMKKPENQALVAPAVASEAARAKWKKELERSCLRCRYETEKLKRSMEDYEKKETQRLGRQLLVLCAEKTIARFEEKSKTSGYNPINERQLKWLEIQRMSNNLDIFDEKAWQQQQRNQLRYNMLLKEVEEIEKLLAAG